MKLDRKSFLLNLGAAFAALGIKATPTDADAENTTITEEVRLRVSGRDDYLAHQIEVPTCLKGFEDLGIPEEDVVALAVSAYSMRKMMQARAAARRPLEDWEWESRKLTYEEQRNWELTHPKPIPDFDAAQAALDAPWVPLRQRRSTVRNVRL